MVEAIKNLTKNSLKQQPIQSQSFTSDSDANHPISTVSPVYGKEINLDNTNMNTSAMNDELCNKNAHIVVKKIQQQFNIGAIRGGKEKEKK